MLEAASGLPVVATSRRIAPFSLVQLTSCAIDPRQFDVLVAKGVNAPIAAYSDVCKSFLRTNTPGYTCADMTSLDFAHRRRPMFPSERHAQWERAPSRGSLVRRDVIGHSGRAGACFLVGSGEILREPVLKPNFAAWRR